MNNFNKILVGALLLAACGDDAKKTPDAPVSHDAAIDATPPPAPPTLGAQIDRLGRPTVNTALNHVFDPTLAGAAAKDAYNADGATGSWRTNTTYLTEFATNLAIFDALDTGIPTSAIAGAGCGNGIFFNANGTNAATSYGALAGVLADDQLYTDTAKGACNLYLALEVEVATQGAVPHTSCGGRTPSYDVIDATYSAVAAGLNGFTLPNFTPKVQDGAVVHADVSDTTFPFLGEPH